MGSRSAERNVWPGARSDLSEEGGDGTIWAGGDNAALGLVDAKAGEEGEGGDNGEGRRNGRDMEGGKSEVVREGVELNVGKGR